MFSIRLRCALGTAIVVALAASASNADNDASSPAPLTPAGAIQRLKEGHARFLADRPAPRLASMQQRVQQAMEQHPFAVILTCADSRVAPELIFDQGLGDLFVLRVAGNVTETGVVGSIEYAIEHLHCPLILVLGHENCGAVTAAMHLDEIHGNLASLVEQVRLGKDLPRDPRAALDEAVERNARYHANELRYKSLRLKEASASGRVQIVAGVYSLTTGQVRWFELPADAPSDDKEGSPGK